MTELVIVLAVVAVMAAILIPTFVTVLNRSKDAAYEEERRGRLVEDRYEQALNDRYFSWEDLENLLALKLADGQSLTAEQLLAALQTAAQNYSGSALTAEEVEKIFARTVSGKLTEGQIEQIAAAVADQHGGSATLTESQMQEIIDEVMQRVSAQEEDVITRAVARALAGKSVDSADLRTAIIAALENILQSGGLALNGTQIDDLLQAAATKPAPTPTPTTTPTPAQTPTPTATPVQTPTPVIPTTTPTVTPVQTPTPVPSTPTPVPSTPTPTTPTPTETPAPSYAFRLNGTDYESFENFQMPSGSDIHFVFISDCTVPYLAFEGKDSVKLDLNGCTLIMEEGLAFFNIPQIEIIDSVGTGSMIFENPTDGHQGYFYIYLDNNHPTNLTEILVNDGTYDARNCPENLSVDLFYFIKSSEQNTITFDVPTARFLVADGKTIMNESNVIFANKNWTTE